VIKKHPKAEKIFAKEQERDPKEMFMAPQHQTFELNIKIYMGFITNLITALYDLLDDGIVLSDTFRVLANRGNLLNLGLIDFLFENWTRLYHR
jgi:hypothetical protein